MSQSFYTNCKTKLQKIFSLGKQKKNAIKFFYKRQNLIVKKFYQWKAKQKCQKVFLQKAKPNCKNDFLRILNPNQKSQKFPYKRQKKTNFLTKTNDKNVFANAKSKTEKFSRKWSKFFAIKTLFAKCFWNAKPKTEKCFCNCKQSMQNFWQKSWQTGKLKNKKVLQMQTANREKSFCKMGEHFWQT